MIENDYNQLGLNPQTISLICSKSVVKLRNPLKLEIAISKFEFNYPKLIGETANSRYG